MKHIIACIDGSTYSDHVCDASLWAAQKLEKSILLLHALEKTHARREDFSGTIGLGARSTLLKEMAGQDQQHNTSALAQGKEMLARAEHHLAQQGALRVETTQRHSDIVEAICDLESAARLVVIGRSGKAHSDSRALGAHLTQIIREIHTPLLITPPEFRPPNRFLLAYDGRETADHAVMRIIEGGLLHNMHCHLVSVKNASSQLPEKLRQTEARLKAHGFAVTSALLEGNPFEALMNYQREHPVDLLVMGAFSRSRLAQIFLGSTTLKMINHTALPLIVLR